MVWDIGVWAGKYPVLVKLGHYFRRVLRYVLNSSWDIEVTVPDWQHESCTRGHILLLLNVTGRICDL